MKSLSAFLITLFRRLRLRRSELRLSIRVVAAGVIAFALVHLLGLPQGFWAVITAVLVVQASVGGSLKVSRDQLLGAVGGAVVGGAVAFAVPHSDLVSLGIALGLALLPLALLGATYPSLRLAPITAVITLLSPTASQLTVGQFAIDRIFEIALGCIVGLFVSLLIFPARAHGLLAETASRTLSLLAELLPVTLGGLLQPLDTAAMLDLQAKVRRSLTALEVAVADARNERASLLSDAPDPEPMLRTSLRLRSDLVMIGRAAGAPLIDPVLARLHEAISGVSSAGRDVLVAASAALVPRQPAPSLDSYSAALRAYDEAIAAIRREGLTRDLSGEAVGRLFAVGFALEQLGRDLQDLVSRIDELARPRPAARPPAAEHV